jgi:hypothetical protein
MLSVTISMPTLIFTATDFFGILNDENNPLSHITVYVLIFVLIIIGINLYLGLKAVPFPKQAGINSPN